MTQSQEPESDFGHPAACYGMGCPHRSECALYAELGTSEGIVWATCWDGLTWSKFAPVERQKS